MQVKEILAVGGLLRLRLGGWLFQAAAVAGYCLLRVLGQVVVEMPPVGDLVGFRGTLAGAVGVGACPVAADDCGSGVGFQPIGEGTRLAVAQQVHGLAGLGVDQDGPVVPAAAEREVVHAQDRDGPGLGFGQRHDQPQQAGPAGGQVQCRGKACPGPPSRI